jgi:hypothetical protein
MAGDDQQHIPEGVNPFIATLPPGKTFRAFPANQCSNVRVASPVDGVISWRGLCRQCIAVLLVMVAIGRPIR